MKLKETELKENEYVPFKVKDNNIYFDGTGYVIDIFEFMDGETPMYSTLTRVKKLQDAEFLAKTITSDNSNYEDIIKIVPNYMEMQI